jgi:hypothetical protein
MSRDYRSEAQLGMWESSRVVAKRYCTVRYVAEARLRDAGSDSRSRCPPCKSL